MNILIHGDSLEMLKELDENSVDSVVCDPPYELNFMNNGTILDPFAGSGSTGIAAIQEGFNFIGIEKEAEYVTICKHRLLFVDKDLDVIAA